jgi:undecaprenyl-diphosphatase
LTLAEAIALGVIQGFTEFLPISSDGHLALAHMFIGTETGESDLLFDVFLHLGTMLAIVVMLRHRVFELIRAALALVHGKSVDPATRVQQQWILWIVVASIPTAIVGLTLERTTEWMRLDPLWVGLWFLVTGALVLAAERIGERKRGAEQLGAADALWIGAAQGLAVLPGLSRSGTTVATALWRNLDAAVAVDFSLLISVPAVLGANLLKLRDVESVAGAPLLAGFLASTATGFVAVKLLQWIVITRRLMPFGIYCLLLGAATIGVSLLGG